MIESGPTWGPANRGPSRLALDDEPGRLDALDVLAEVVTPAKFCDENLLSLVHLPDGESQPRAWQQRRVVLRLCMVCHRSRPGLRELQGWISIRSARL